MLQIQDGYFDATGAAQNIEVGFIPSFVHIVNVTNGTEAFYFKVMDDIIEFDGGGTNEIIGGYIVQASDGGWSGVVKQVVVHAGTWAGGNAEGFIILEPGTLEGRANVADNDVIRVATQKGGTPAGDWATVDTAGLKGPTFSLTTELGTTANATIAPYEGTSGGNSAGFTLGTALGANGNLMYYIAYGGGAG